MILISNTLPMAGIKTSQIVQPSAVVLMILLGRNNKKGASARNQIDNPAPVEQVPVRVDDNTSVG
ncbi:MAG: hypothetical protein ABSH28_00505 [Acidobacteriota bacterium]